MRKGLGLIDLSVAEVETGMNGGVALNRESADILIAVALSGLGGKIFKATTIDSQLGVLMVVVMDCICLWQRSR
jgi:hypothetical protein